MTKETLDALATQYKTYLFDYRDKMKNWAEEPAVNSQWTPAFMEVEKARAKANGFNEALRIIAEKENIILYE